MEVAGGLTNIYNNLESVQGIMTKIQQLRSLLCAMLKGEKENKKQKKCVLAPTRRWNHPALETGDLPDPVSDSARYSDIPDGDTLPDYMEVWNSSTCSLPQDD